MKRLFDCAAILALTSGTALAADPSPIGDWRVKDGYANVENPDVYTRIASENVSTGNNTAARKR
jgi:hypothetical protein